jgi:hypothetical protein
MADDFADIAVPITQDDFADIAQPIEAKDDFAAIAEPIPEQEKDGRIGEEEIAAIAQKHGANTQDLIDAAGWFQGVIKGKELEPAEIGKAVAGKVSETFLAGIPTFIYKKMQDEPTRKAIDELKDLIADRESTAQAWVGGLTDVAGGIAGGGILAKAAPTILTGTTAARTEKAAELASSLQKAGKFTAQAGQLAKSAGTAKDLAIIPGTALPFATGFLTESKEGEEIKQALLGLAIGAAAGVGGRAVGKAIQKSVTSNLDKEIAQRAVKAGTENDVNEFLKKMPKETGEDIVRRADAIMSVDAPEYALQKKLVLAKELDEADMNVLRTRAAKEVDPEDTVATEQVIQEEIESARKENIREFTRYLGRQKGESPDNFLAEKIRVDGESFVETQLGGWQRAKAVQQGIKEGFISPVEQGGVSVFSTMYDAIKARFKGLRDIDRRLGTDNEVTKDELSEAITNISNIKQRWYMVARELASERKATGLDDYRAIGIIEGKIPETGLTPEQLTNITKTRQMFSDLRNEVNTRYGMGIEEKANYIPHAIADAATVLQRFDAAYARIKSDINLDLLGDITPDALDRLKKHKFGKQVLRSLEVVNGTPIRNATELQKVASNMVSSKFLGSRKFAKASSAMRRDGDIPPLIREENVEALMQKWVANTFHYAEMRAPLAKLDESIAVAKAAKDTRSQKYLEKYKESILNPAGREGTMAAGVKNALSTFSLNMHKAALQATNPITRQAYQLLAETPEIFGIINTQVYPNFLGLNIRATLTNIMQPIFNTLPELGLANAHHVMGAYLKTIKQLSMGETIVLKNVELAKKLGRQVGEEITTRQPAIVLMNEGLKPAQWNTELAGTIHTAMNKHPFTKALGGVSDKWASVAMYMYEAAETSNRIVARNIANSMSESLTKEFASRQGGSVLNFLKTVGPAYRKEILNSLKEGNEDKTRELMGKYIMSRTIYNYDKASIGEFAEFVGPLFAAFTRWPVEKTSDVIEDLTQRGVIKGGLTVGAKLLAPFAALMYVNDTFLESRDEPGIQRLLFGKNGITSMSPVGSVKTMIDPILGEGGGILASPLVGNIQGILAGASAMKDGDTEALQKAFTNTAKSYTPVVGTAWRFLSQDTGIID